MYSGRGGSRQEPLQVGVCVKWRDCQVRGASAVVRGLPAEDQGDEAGRALPIQSGDPRIRSSDKSLSNREFATSAVGKNDAIVGGCRGQRGQKRCQCHLRNRHPSRLCRSRKILLWARRIETQTETMTLNLRSGQAKEYAMSRQDFVTHWPTRPSECEQQEYRLRNASCSETIPQAPVRFWSACRRAGGKPGGLQKGFNSLISFEMHTPVVARLSHQAMTSCGRPPTEHIGT